MSPEIAIRHMWGAASRKTLHKKSVVAKSYITFGVACCSRSLVVRGRWWSLGRWRVGGRLGHPLKKSNNPNTEGWGVEKQIYRACDLQELSLG